ncbi:hypothetical protein HX810_12000 [Pseudomonas salomonii]|uniref:Uncharacterized protein n=1 Tax=Pseudomonas salomonii TaxID=191391 RepID=A0A7Y8KP96_9PSED|nr:MULTISPECIES: hypothetical protein [Pseudomonas]NWF08377.1 hypothetical protein [Pseudomonas salomonii]
MTIDLATCLTIGATFIALIAVIISGWTAWMQRQHNKLSFSPFPEIQLRDMNGQVRIQISNNGTGPLIIQTLTVKRNDVVVGKTLIELMPPNGQWSFFVHEIDGRSIKPAGDIILLDFKYDPENQKELDFANHTRKALCTLEIEITYKNIYNDILPIYKKNLTWFSRLI